MEVKEEEAKICRLCGQTDNISIDVFSEDGTSRFLRFKIHSKINILIEEDDELPTAVCIKCIGALEFLCDFYDWCHRTQRTFNDQLKIISEHSEIESDKENISPEQKSKRKLKTKIFENQDKSASKKNESLTKETVIFQQEAIDFECTNENLKTTTTTTAGSTKTTRATTKAAITTATTIKAADTTKAATTKATTTKAAISTTTKVAETTKAAITTAAITTATTTAATTVATTTTTKETTKAKTKGKLETIKKATSPIVDKEHIVNVEKIDVLSPKRDIGKINNNNNLEKIKTNVKSIVTPLTNWLTGNAMNNKRKRVNNPVVINKVNSRLSESRYSKVSELMTDEQKETIENYYRVDMSVVDENKVAENIEIYSRNEIECKICKQKYNRMDKCQVHIWRHLDMKPYFCSACDFTTLTVSNIRCHIRKSHLKLKPYVCPLCEKQYTSPTSLEEHLNTHTGAKPYRCDKCEFACASKQVLSYHRLTHKQEKDVECDVCGKTFYSKGRLRSHKFIHNKDTSFKCIHCSTYFMNKESLEKHYNTSHVKDYECNVCNKKYKSKKALNNHQNVHSEAKYQCTLCPRRYKSHHILKEHILKHGGIRKYKCETCEKTFAQQSHLAAHMAVHNGIRYDCPGCKKGFNRHDNMKAHTKRCSQFLRDPSLKELLTRKKKLKTESVSSIDTNIDNMSISSKSSMNSGRINSTSAKKIITKIEHNVSVENSDVDEDDDDDDDDDDDNDDDDDDQSDSEYIYQNHENSRKTSEILHSLVDSDDDDDEDIITRNELSVTENILSPECF